MSNELVYSTCPFKPDLIGNKARNKKVQRLKAKEEREDKEKQEYILAKESDINKMKMTIFANGFGEKYVQRIFGLSGEDDAHVQKMISLNRSSHNDGKLDELSESGRKERIHTRQYETCELFDQWEKDIRMRLDSLEVGV